MMTEISHDKIVAQGRKYVLGLRLEGWQLDDFKEDDFGATWMLYQIRSHKRGMVSVNGKFLHEGVKSNGSLICGFFAVNGIIKSLIPV